MSPTETYLHFSFTFFFVLFISKTAATATAFDHQMSMSEKIEIDFLLFCCVQFNAAVSISVRSNTMSIRFIAITQLLLFEKH